jgi:hypothetical protein
MNVRPTHQTPRLRAGRTRWFAVAVALALTLPLQAGTISQPQARPDHISLAAHPAYAGVGLIRTTTPSGGRFLASGTLINNQYLITAAHVVDRASNLTFELGGQTYQAQQWTMHPRWRGDNFNSGFDLAVVQLTEPVSGVRKVPLMRNQREVGRIGTIVGFGQSGTGDSGATTPSGIKLAGQSRIERAIGGQDRLLQTIFAGPDDNPLPLEFQPAPGDSGGGLFIGNRLAGVVSFLSAADGIADASFGDAGNYVRISRHLDLIDQALRELRNPTARRRHRQRNLPRLTFGRPGQPIFDDPIVFPVTNASMTPLNTALTVPEPAGFAAWSLLVLLWPGGRRSRTRSMRGVTRPPLSCGAGCGDSAARSDAPRRGSPGTA